VTEDSQGGAGPARAATATDRPGLTVTRNLAAPPEAVMATLLRAEMFPVWTVGPGRVVAVDADWPGVGSGFTHETGRGPLRLRDRTTVQHVDADGGHLTLRADVRPFGSATIQLHVTPHGTGSRVVMHERPLSGPGSWLPQPLYRPTLAARNLIALHRLERLVLDAPQQAAG
jgi:uncharacterized protein YndB with AHSA1/START domain